MAVEFGEEELNGGGEQESRACRAGTDLDETWKTNRGANSRD
jgi:hypothetical protein